MMISEKKKVDRRKVTIAVILTAFLGFIVWTELHPYGVACGGISTMCSMTVSQCAGAVTMYALENDGALPDSLEILVPEYLPRTPTCCGSFNGCRPLTLFQIQSNLDTLLSHNPGPERVPEYRIYEDDFGRQQFKVFCTRDHNGRCRYSSETEDFEADWDWSPPQRPGFRQRALSLFRWR